MNAPRLEFAFRLEVALGPIRKMWASRAGERRITPTIVGTVSAKSVALRSICMLFKQKLGQMNVTTLVERVSRITVIPKFPNKRTKPVMGKIIETIRDLPLAGHRSITFDRGTEFVK